MWYALYKKELSGFFYSGSAYFIMLIYAALSLLTAIFFGAYLLVDVSDMRAYFFFQPQILALIVPAVTVRLWSEERRSGTLESLFTFPFSNFTLATTKFAAGWSFVLVLSLFFLPLAFSSGRLVAPDCGNIASAWLGVALTGGLLTAWGCVVAFLTTSSAAAYLIASAFSWVVVTFNFSPIINSNGGEFLFPAFPSAFADFLNGDFGPVDLLWFVLLTLWGQLVLLLLITAERSR